MKSIADFREFYERELIHYVKESESLRKKAFSLTIRSVSKAGLICFVLWGLIYTFVPESFNFYFYAGTFVISIMLYRIWNKGNFEEFCQYYNLNVMDRIVKFIEPSLDYRPDVYISFEFYKLSRLFNVDVDRYEGSDFIYGKIGKTSIMFSQIHALQKKEETTTDSDGNTETRTYWVTIFKGIFFIADFNKHFNSNVILIPKKLGYGSRLWQNKIILEDPEFMREFNVYAKDPIEARFILSTSLMKRILSLKELMDTEIYISFSEPYIYIGIPTNTLFRPNYLKNVNNYYIYEVYFSWLSHIIGIVDVLDLNTRIWSKM